MRGSQKIEDSERNILWVDDDKVIRMLGKELLNFLGFRTATAKNGKEALKILEETTFSTIITDMDMPVMNGYDFIQKFRKKHGKKCRIIVISGSKEYLDLIADFKLADHTILKPLSLTKLREALL